MSAPSPRHVRELLEGFTPECLGHLTESDRELAVTGVTSDSRAVKAGTIFVAVRGGAHDGHAFIPAVQQAGAALIVGEDAPPARAAAPYIQVPDSRLALARLAANFAGNPSRELVVVGVTGTSGKTTTTYLMESILQAAGHTVGVIGTVNFRIGDQVLPATHTTPGAVELQRLLRQMIDEGATAVVMEVSSHALKQHRVAYLAYDAMIFTNLSPEHLDFHPDMDDYFETKTRLFTEGTRCSILAGKRPFASVNGDDAYGRKLLDRLRAEAPPELWYAAYGLDAAADVSGSGLRVGLDGIRGEAGGVRVESALTGNFNASNILGALAAAQGLGIDAGTIARGLSRLKVVPGRLERVPNSRDLNVLVDYAHKPDALEKVLHTLRGVRGANRLITVFGCGGDRDRTKRPVMGKLAVELSDQVFITSDNPRTEDPEAIIREIVKGTAGHANYTVEADRKEAIRAAIAFARAGDLVLIAGKGHEDYQILGDPRHAGQTYKIHFDDREVAAEAIREKSGG